MALDTYALTTLARFKAWVGDSSSTNDTAYEYAINAASARIERYIGRQIMARDRIEFLDPMGHDVLKLPQYPVNQCRFIGYGAKTSLTVSADAAVGDLSATVQVRENAVTTARNLSSGATNTGFDYDFTPTAPAYTMASEIQPLIDAATGFVCSLDWNAPLRYLHKTGPIDVTDNPAYLTAPDIRATDFRIDAGRGLVYLGSSYRAMQWPEDSWGNFGGAAQSVCVDYNAGYSTVPADIEEACWLVSKALFDYRKRDQTLNSESLGDYSYSGGGPDRLSAILEEALADWREIR